MSDDFFTKLFWEADKKHVPAPVLQRQIAVTWCNNICPKCKSSMKRKWLLFGKAKCIHPKCGYEE